MRKFRTLLLIAVVTLAASEPTLACSVCYGAAEAPILAGMNLSIIFMLALTYVVLGGFATFFFYLRKREKLFREES